MPGINTIISDSRIDKKIMRSVLDDLLHEDNFKIKIMTKTSKHLAAISYHDGYPFLKWENGNIQIILEGMIYNKSEDDVKTQINEISRKFMDDTGYKELIKKFVESTDGDYIIQIWEKNGGRFLIFNDYLGRLPLYFYCLDGLCVFSKEIKTILRVIPEINLNKKSLVEFLMFEYPLGKKTLFRDIFRLHPSQLIVVNSGKNGIKFNVINSTKFNFVLKDSFKDKKESIDFLKKVFLKSVENRIKVLEKKDYRIIADLSGGYDSRTVLAGLSRFTNKVSYFTFEYTRDESPWAQNFFRRMGSPGSYHKLNLTDTSVSQDIGSLVYKTDGLVNFNTTSVCYRDVKSLKKQIPKITARFSGLGGEFIRHPFKHYYHSLLNSLEKGFYSALPLGVACEILEVDLNKYKKHFMNYLNESPEKTPEDRLKKFYHEYYNHYVGAAAEDRERIHFWTVQPLWSLEFTRAIFSRIPLNWVGYKFYIQFMKSLDPRLLNSPIRGSNINLKSKLSIDIHEIQGKLKKNLYFKIKAKTPNMVNFYKYLCYQKKLKNKIIINSMKKTRSYYKYFNNFKDFFNPDVLEENLFKVDVDANRVANRIITLLIYFEQIEKRFGGKKIYFS